MLKYRPHALHRNWLVPGPAGDGIWSSCSSPLQTAFHTKAALPVTQLPDKSQENEQSGGFRRAGRGKLRSRHEGPWACHCSTRRPESSEGRRHRNALQRVRERNSRRIASGVSLLRGLRATGMKTLETVVRKQRRPRLLRSPLKRVKIARDSAFESPANRFLAQVLSPAPAKRDSQRVTSVVLNSGSDCSLASLASFASSRAEPSTR